MIVHLLCVSEQYDRILSLVLVAGAVLAEHGASGKAAPTTVKHQPVLQTNTEYTANGQKHILH